MRPPIQAFGAKDLELLVRTSLSAAREGYKTVIALSNDSTISDKTFLESIHTSFCHLDQMLMPCELFSNVHPEKECRDTLILLEQEGKNLATQFGTDAQMYKRLSSIDQSTLSPLELRFVQKIIQDMELSGAHLDAATREKVQEFQKDIARLSQDYERNITDGVQKMLVHPADLKGLPSDYVASHVPNSNGMIEITTNYPDYFPFMTYAENRDRREELELLFLSRAKKTNGAVLQELLQKRQAFAALLGFSSWAEYVIKDKMTKTPSTVTHFLESIHTFAKERAEEEVRTLTVFAQKHGHTDGLKSWDLPYYRNLFRKETFAFDTAAIRRYFSYAEVQRGLFGLVEELFDLVIEKRQVDLWHESVESFAVKKKTGEMMGYFYLDMFPREGKYGHAAQFTVASGIRGAVMPEAALVCNFPDPAKHPEKVSLLGYDEVKTFFHEFGHLLHTICGGHQEFVSQSGVRTEWDFVEVPSQLFETWSMSYEVLSRFAYTYDTHEPITEQMVESLRQANDWGKGLFATQQVFQATLSFIYHSDSVPDIASDTLLRELQEKHSVIPFHEGTRFDLTFGHLTGYSAIYYTYLWSLALAKDMTSVFEHVGLLDKATAHRYRDVILAPGGSKPAATLLEEFLGRPHTFLAFETWLKG